MDVIDRIKKRFGENEPFFVEDFKKEFTGYSNPWIFQTLKRLTDDSKIIRFDTGVYYIPTKTQLGVSSISTNKVIKKKFISNGNDVYGFYTGLILENAIGLTTQVPNIIEIVSNKESARVRDIKIGHQTVRARSARTNITKDNVNILQVLDLMKNISISDLDEIEKSNLIKYVREQKIKMTDIAQYSKFYPAKMVQKLIESGVINEFTQ